MTGASVIIAVPTVSCVASARSNSAMMRPWRRRIVRSQKRGRVRICWIDPAALADAEQWIAHSRAGWEHQLDRLGDVLEELADDAAPDAAA